MTWNKKYRFNMDDNFYKYLISPLGVNKSSFSLDLPFNKAIYRLFKIFQSITCENLFGIYLGNNIIVKLNKTHRRENLVFNWKTKLDSFVGLHWFSFKIIAKDLYFEKLSCYMLYSTCSGNYSIKLNRIKWIVYCVETHLYFQVEFQTKNSKSNTT